MLPAGQWKPGRRGPAASGGSALASPSLESEATASASESPAGSGTPACRGPAGRRRRCAVKPCAAKAVEAAPEGVQARRPTPGGHMLPAQGGRPRWPSLTSRSGSPTDPAKAPQTGVLSARILPMSARTVSRRRRSVGSVGRSRILSCACMLLCLFARVSSEPG